jgi:putative transposase
VGVDHDDPRDLLDPSSWRRVAARMDGVHYLPMRCTDRRADDGIAPTIALAEAVIGLFKPEVIQRNRRCRSLGAVEFATREWVDWFTHRRLLGPIGDIPPAAFEALYHDQAKVA